MSNFKRYTKTNTLTAFPRVKISERDTDLFLEFKSTDKLENIAANTYGDPSLWWIILMANPEYTLEYDIEPGEIIRIPLPINSVVKEIRDQLNA